VSDAGTTPRLGWGFWSFIAFMALLAALFVMLGVWQLNRLAEKDALVASVEERTHLPPIELPTVGQWGGLDAATFSYRPVKLTGKFNKAQTVFVFTSLTDAKGKFSGPGYWVMTPMALEGGGTVFVNRGFVPQSAAASFLAAETGISATQTLVGMALKPELAGAFTPGPDRAARIDWLRNPERLAQMLNPPPDPLAEYFVDAPAGEPGALPQGGETIIEFPNNHLGYALTWFGFALITPILLGFWIYRQVAGKPKKVAAGAPNH
jgi:surfeit locus 1 family protein